METLLRATLQAGQPKKHVMMDSGKDAAPFPAKWKECGSVRHVFTHFELELTIYRAAIDMPAPEGHWWSLDYSAEALPTLMKKVIETALSFEP